MIVRRHALIALSLLTAYTAWGQVVSQGNTLCSLGDGSGSWASVELAQQLIIPAGQTELCRTNGTIEGSRGSGSHRCCFRDVSEHGPGESARERRIRIAENRRLMPTMVESPAGSGTYTRRRRESDDSPIFGYQLITRDATAGTEPVSCPADDAADPAVTIRFGAPIFEEDEDGRRRSVGTQVFEFSCTRLAGETRPLGTFRIEDLRGIFPEIAQISGTPPRARVGTRTYGGKGGRKARGSSGSSRSSGGSGESHGHGHGGTSADE